MLNHNTTFKPLTAYLFSFLIILAVTSCKPEFAPFDLGHDACIQCKMTILDSHYACEILTKHGKALKFDDVGCLLKYRKENSMKDQDLIIYVADYSNSKIINGRQAFYLHSDVFKSPMNGNIAAFENSKEAKSFMGSMHKDILSWGDISHVER